jgi:hypothetical protein
VKARTGLLRRLREIAVTLDITERSAHTIVSELIDV